MDVKLKYFGRVNDGGQLHIIHRKRFDEELKLLAGKEVEIEVKRKKKTRSLSQNAYYWGIVVPMIREALIEAWGEKNISKEQTHEILKRECNKIEIVNPDHGDILVIGGETKDMTTTEYMEYLEKCRQWASIWLNIDIPEPNEQAMLKFEE